MKQITIILTALSFIFCFSFNHKTVSERIPRVHAPTKLTLEQIDKKLFGKWIYQFSFYNDSIFQSNQSPRSPHELIFFNKTDSSKYLKQGIINCQPKLTLLNDTLGSSNLWVLQDKTILVPALFAYSKETNDTVHLQMLTYCGYSKRLMNVLTTLNKDTMLLSTTWATHFYLRRN